MPINNLYLELYPYSRLDKMTREDKEMLQIKLWALLAHVAKKYTMGDSTSVPIETAEELLKSICFLLKSKIKNSQKRDKMFEFEDLEKLWEEACVSIEKKIKRSKRLLEKVIKSSPSIENILYTDTIFEISRGLRVYNYKFLAHEIPCSMDYELSNPVNEELQGIEYINEYLKRLLFENKFCSNFDDEKIIGILNSYCGDYNESLINIYDPIITNAIGLELLDEDILKLEMRRYQREVLLCTFKNMATEKIKEELMKSSYSICDKLKIDKEFEKEYIKETAMKLLPRLKEGIKNNILNNIFLSFKYEESLTKDIYVDNKNMDDKKLRRLIDEIKFCRFTKDKIAIIRKNVYSLDDLIEIFNNCIWPCEIEEVANSLNEDEIMLINYYLNNKLGDYESNTTWEKSFTKVRKRDMTF